MEKIEIAEKILNQKIDVKKIWIAGEKILACNIVVKNSRLVKCCEKSRVEKCEKSEICENLQGKTLLWRILVGKWVEKTVTAVKSFKSENWRKKFGKMW